MKNKSLLLVVLIGCILVGCTSQQPPILTSEQMQQRTAIAVQNHLNICTGCKVTDDPNYGEMILPCKDYYSVIKKSRRIGNWVWCNQGWVKLSDHPELK